MCLQGQRYNKGDFTLKLLSASQTMTGISGQHVFLGHVLEVEYMPLQHLEMAQPIMQVSGSERLSPAHYASGHPCFRQSLRPSCISSPGLRPPHHHA